MREKLLEFLRAIEWSGDAVHYICPSCRRWQMHGHEKDCKLVALVHELEESTLDRDDRMKALVRELADVYTVDTDQARLVDLAHRAVRLKREGLVD